MRAGEIGKYQKLLSQQYPIRLFIVYYVLEFTFEKSQIYTQSAKVQGGDLKARGLVKTFVLSS